MSRIFSSVDLGVGGVAVLACFCFTMAPLPAPASLLGPCSSHSLLVFLLPRMKNWLELFWKALFFRAYVFSTKICKSSLYLEPQNQINGPFKRGKKKRGKSLALREVSKIVANYRNLKPEIDDDWRRPLKGAAPLILSPPPPPPPQRWKRIFE